MPQARHRRPTKTSHPTRRALLLGAGGVAVVGAGATLAPRPGPPVDLDRFTLVFEDDFRALDVTARGPGSKWIAHTPWNGDFGDASFTDPQPDFPFAATPGGLTITARKGADSRWQSGLLRLFAAVRLFRDARQAAGRLRRLAGLLARQLRAQGLDRSQHRNRRA
jgi:hypothetical protein